jgi:hypothetical protein
MSKTSKQYANVPVFQLRNRLFENRKDPYKTINTNIKSRNPSVPKGKR